MATLVKLNKEQQQKLAQVMFRSLFSTIEGLNPHSKNIDFDQVTDVVLALNQEILSIEVDEINPHSQAEKELLEGIKDFCASLIKMSNDFLEKHK